jgi:hypothetical protein
MACLIKLGYTNKIANKFKDVLKFIYQVSVGRVYKSKHKDVTNNKNNN